MITTTQPKVQFQPLKRSGDGTYRPSAATTKAGTTVASKPTSRVVLTGDPATAVDGRIVLQGDLATPSSGVGGTPAAPLPRGNGNISANGERVPYKDLSSRDYPEYSVTRAAEDGVEPVAVDDGSSLHGGAGR